jgi:hypothetical protein
MSSPRSPWISVGYGPAPTLVVYALTCTMHPSPIDQMGDARQMVRLLAECTQCGAAAYY